ncbi:MAG: NAD(P)H-dependent oxidoreductase [Chitinispirillia bacterium]|jgi:glutathione-regulated potassium-efflux system ancillary protein KefG
MTRQIPILILFAHPCLQKSRINRVLIQAVHDLESVRVNDLYELYPDFYIDVKKEQQLLLNHDIIIFQFPFLWYSTPALLKEWEDIVLEHGWAYGSKGYALQNKKLFCTVSTGGGESAYHKGDNRFSMRQLLAPIERSAYLCGMDFLPPFVIHGAHLMQKEHIQEYGERYRRLLFALTHGKVNYNKLSQLESLNTNLDSIIFD